MADGEHAGISSYLPGMAAALLIAAAASLLAFGHSALDPLVLSMLISIIIGNLFGTSGMLASGVALSHRVLIPAGIILYGTQLQFQPLRTLGAGRILYLITMVVAGLAATYALARALSIKRTVSLLLAAGSSICGASAIVVLSPVIGAEKEDTSVSLLAITVVGLAGVILYPLLQEMVPINDRVYGLLCGSTLNQMGQVKAAAALISQTSLALAVPVKLIRVATLLPVAVALSLSAVGGRKPFIPWFIVAFASVAVLVNVVPGLESASAALGPIVTFIFSTAIAGIGLSIDLESIIDAGPRPLITVFSSWLFLVGLFALGFRLVF